MRHFLARVIFTCVIACAPAWLLAAQAVAQSVPSKGSASTFEVATWNVEWFGSASNGPGNEAQQLENVARVMRTSQIDLWALQEIDDDDHFQALVDELGDGWHGELSTEGTNFKLGYVYRTDVVHVTQREAYLTQFADEFAGRPPFRLQADIRLPTDTLANAVFLNLHMKAFGDASSYERRDEASFRLKTRLEFDYADEPVIILGDFNDELTESIRSGRPSPYEEFVADADDYAFLTLDMDRQNVPTWCGGSTCTSGSTFDHILITDELFDAYEEGSAVRYEELLGAIDQYTSTTSDHLPVFARFTFSTNTAVEDLPSRRVALAAFPNPFSAESRVEYTTATAGAAVLTLFDVTGRLVDRREAPVQQAGSHVFRIDGTRLSAGVYLAVVAHADGVSTTRLVVAH